jgi:hypothetical protein
MKPTPTLPADDSPPLLAPPWRTIISFLLFLQLFAISVAVLSNELPSPLEVGLRRVVAPYLKLLTMDLSYAYNLTFGFNGSEAEAMQDTAYWLEADLKLPGGQAMNVVLPSPGLQPRQRYRRYERMAKRAAAALGTPSTAGALPGAIAAQLVKETGATGGTIRLLRRDLPVEPYQPYSAQPRKLYEARILVAAGQVQLLKIESSKSDTAPAATPAKQ